MHKDEIKNLFDQQAAKYDQQWRPTAPIRDALLLLLAAGFAELPAAARVLCVGAGTGEEILYLAQRFPQWTFVAVEPSGAMLTVCRDKLARAGIAQRCDFHQGYVESLPTQTPFDAATCLLVSQFILEPDARVEFFRGIATRLKPGGILASSDLASDVNSDEYDALLKIWLNLMASTGISAEGLEKMRATYARDVAILPPARVAGLLESAGFEAPVKLYQAGLIHAWLSRRASGDAAANKRPLPGDGSTDQVA